MPYRILAVDLDNTLIDGRAGLSTRNRQALHKAEEAGCRVVICTARGRWSTRPTLQQIGSISGPHIVFNGAARFVSFDMAPDEVLAMDCELLAQRFAAAAPVEAGVMGFEDPRLGDCIYVSQPTPGLEGWVQDNPERARVVSSVEEVLARDLVALLCWGPESALVALARRLGEHEGFTAPRVAPALQHDSWLLELTAAGATKGAALERLARRLGVDQDEVIAVGDAPADISMIEYAGLGVAVGNAGDEVRAAADYVAPPAGEDAVAHIVERFVLSHD